MADGSRILVSWSSTLQRQLDTDDTITCVGLSTFTRWQVLLSSDLGSLIWLSAELDSVVCLSGSIRQQELAMSPCPQVS